MVKIDSATTDQSAAARHVELNREPDAARSRDRTRGGSDEVHISTDAALLNRAMLIAESMPDVRPALVSQMKEELAQGRVGSDVERLANRIIDRLLEE